MYANCDPDNENWYWEYGYDELLLSHDHYNNETAEANETVTTKKDIPRSSIKQTRSSLPLSLQKQTRSTNQRLNTTTYTELAKSTAESQVASLAKQMVTELELVNDCSSIVQVSSMLDGSIDNVHDLTSQTFYWAILFSYTLLSSADGDIPSTPVQAVIQPIIEWTRRMDIYEFCPIPFTDENWTSTYLSKIYVPGTSSTSGAMSLVGESKLFGEDGSYFVASSRFSGDLAFISGDDYDYENQLPFVVVDLSDPTSPKTVGSLQVDCILSYLEEIDVNGASYILGIGTETDTTTYEAIDVTHPTVDNYCYYDAAVPSRSFVINLELTTIKDHTAIKTDMAGNVLSELELDKGFNYSVCPDYYYYDVGYPAYAYNDDAEDDTDDST
ncbi:hypothetical protein ACHAWO_011838 [Cyclotella atomus]|uniref:Uncharacterized protein n=1 Tax=Cyclotella atomus TaxID=382360 RepID=A0ABD3PKT9_9STRA